MADELLVPFYHKSQPLKSRIIIILKFSPDPHAPSKYQRLENPERTGKVFEKVLQEGKIFDLKMVLRGLAPRFCLMKR